MKEAISFLTKLFYPEWTPPPEIGVRKFRLMQEINRPIKEKHKPVQARTKILAVLDDMNWKTNDELAKETCLIPSTVAITTDRMYKAGKIERKKKDTPFGYINLYRRK